MVTTSSSSTTKPNTAGDPGLSLWLVPPKDSHVYNVLNRAITEIVPGEAEASDSAPRFEPHLTLASRIPRQSITSDPQQWLEEIDLPTISTVEVRWHELAVGDAYFKKLFIRCQRSSSLLQLASSCRIFSSAESVEADYDPHVSLLYSDDSVSEDTKKRIESKLAKIGMSGIGHADGGWTGGSVWLVPTDGDLADWQPIAQRS